MHPRSPIPVVALLLLAASASLQNPTRQTPSTSFGTISVAEAAAKIHALIDQAAP